MVSQTSVEEIIEAAPTLDPKTRWRVVETIAANLEEDRIPVEDAEALWLEEEARRARDLREGKSDEIPSDEVMARGRERLR